MNKHTWLFKSRLIKMESNWYSFLSGTRHMWLVATLSDSTFASPEKVLLHVQIGKRLH